MKPINNFRKDTLVFLPTRLNRRPVVYKSMTLNELFILLGLGAVIGLIIGLLLVILLRWKLFIIVAFVLILPIIFVVVGYPVIRNLKRHKPDTWLDRMIQLKLTPSAFITTDQPWSIKRSPKILKRSKK